MALNGAGLDDTGFRVPTYQEELDNIQDDFQTRFGTNIPLTSNSNFGILSRIMAYRLTDQWQELQNVYYSAYVSTAIGTALDRIAANNNLTRKVAKPATGQVTIKTDGQYLVQAGEQFETDDGVVFDLINDITTTKQADGTWQATGDVQADEVGSFSNVPAGTVTTVSNPDDDILSVTNPNAMGGGQEDETDTDLRRRIIIETAANPGSTINGIKSALLNVAGIREVGIVQNTTNTKDIYGNPPYSVHVYVLGGRANDIAQALATYSGFGPLYVGSQSVNVPDITGTQKMYYFDFATPVPIYASVTLSTDADFNSDDGLPAVKKAVANYINSLEMGSNVVLTKMYPDIYNIPGVNEATIQIGKSSDALGSTDIHVDTYQAPQCDEGNVEVKVNGD